MLAAAVIMTAALIPAAYVPHLAQQRLDAMSVEQRKKELADNWAYISCPGAEHDQKYPHWPADAVSQTRLLSVTENGVCRLRPGRRPCRIIGGMVPVCD